MTEGGDLPSRAGFRPTADTVLRCALEVGVLAMVCLSPWAFGAAGAEFESVLYVGLAVLLGLWAARIFLQRKLPLKPDPVTLVLVTMILLGAWQLVPLPHRLLSRLSPATAELYERLLPRHAEILPFGATRETPVLSAGSSISLYPGRTRQELLRLVAVLLLFVMVRSSVASSASLRRLAVAALVNGTLLSLFGLIQFFTSASDTLYWTVPSPGTVFGPFVCRNHFAFYLNLCVGLGVGLLLVSRYTGTDGAQGEQDGPRNLLHHPRTLWIIAALSLMISSVIVCASRGGIVAWVGGWVICLGINFLPFLRLRQVGAVLLILSLVFVLVAWFGFARVEARLATLWGNEADKEGRLSLWTRMFSLAQSFPVWGTGYGTFPYVEPLCRSDPTDEEVYSNAENEYLEGLVEGGVVRLALGLLAIGLVFRLGYRAVRRGKGGLEGGLVLGAVFGFATLVVQSVVDFGLHIPAIALLATVLCAHVCAVGTPSSQRWQGERQGHSFRRWGGAPILGAALVMTFSLALGYEGWRMYRVEQLRRAAADHAADSADHAQEIDSLLAAARLAPDNARLQIELALTYYDQYRDERRHVRGREGLADAAQIVADGALLRCPSWAGCSVLTITPASLVTTAARNELSREKEKLLVREYLVPALRCFLQARDLCPLFPEPQRCLADHADKLARGDGRLAYLERAALVVPYDPGLWYACGKEWLDEQPDLAWKHWKRSLQLSDLYLAPILETSAARLGPREICDQVLPHDPKLLLEAALRLYPEATADRQPYLEEALGLLETRSALLAAEDLHLKAVILSALDRSHEASATYEAALAREPRQATWRFEFARLLYQQNRLRESQQELLIVLSYQPDHSAARELLTSVERKIAETM